MSGRAEPGAHFEALPAGGAAASGESDVDVDVDDDLDAGLESGSAGASDSGSENGSAGGEGRRRSGNRRLAASASRAARAVAVRSRAMMALATEVVKPPEGVPGVAFDVARAAAALPHLALHQQPATPGGGLDHDGRAGGGVGGGAADAMSVMSSARMGSAGRAASSKCAPIVVCFSRDAHRQYSRRNRRGRAAAGASGGAGWSGGGRSRADSSMSGFGERRSRRGSVSEWGGGAQGHRRGRADSMSSSVFGGGGVGGGAGSASVMTGVGSTGGGGSRARALVVVCRNDVTG